MATMAQQSMTMDNLITQFKPRYFGFGSNMLGDAAIAYQRRFGDDYEFTDWWQQYEQWKQAQIRSVAGANLTEPELQAYNRFSISPSDSAEIAMRNLRRQADLINRGYMRYITNLQASGFDVEGFEPRGSIAPESVPAELPELPPGAVLLNE